MHHAVHHASACMCISQAGECVAAGISSRLVWTGAASLHQAACMHVSSTRRLPHLPPALLWYSPISFSLMSSASALPVTLLSENSLWALVFTLRSSRAPL
jgi:hypothetical protein